MRDLLSAKYIYMEIYITVMITNCIQLWISQNMSTHFCASFQIVSRVTQIYIYILVVRIMRSVNRNFMRWKWLFSSQRRNVLSIHFIQKSKAHHIICIIKACSDCEKGCYAFKDKRHRRSCFYEMLTAYLTAVISCISLPSQPFKMTTAQSKWQCSVCVNRKKVSN